MEGFKQTEIGWIPEDWEVKELSKLSSKIGDGIHSTPIYCNSSEYRFINGNNLLRGKIEYTENTEYISFREYVKYKKNLINNTILYSINGTIGNIAFYNGEKIVLGKSAAYINLKDIIHKDFVYYFLQSSLVLGYYRNELTGSTINNLSLSTLNNTPILLPPLPEQEAIAKALSDVDSLIDTLERKIAKKRNIKQGAMQRLLTGKQRLPGFSGDWVEKTVEQIADFKRDCFIDGDWIESEHITNDGIRLIQTGNIGIGNFKDKDDKRFINQNSFINLRCKELVEDDILICRLAEPAGRACLVPNLNMKSITSVDITIFRPNESLYDRRFILSMMSTTEWFSAVNERCGGSTRTRISRSALGKIPLLLPPTKAEQSAIARILTDMDNEITTLEQKLDKYKQIKQGMMQELLTGRIRLVKPQ